MKTIFTAPPLKEETQSTYLMGLGLILVSLAIYLLASAAVTNFRGDFSGVAIINFVLSAIYFIAILLVRWTDEEGKRRRDHRLWVNMVVLLTVSAFSLNKDMGIFAPFPLWLNIYTVLVVCTLLSVPYLSVMPTWAKGLMYFLGGLGMVLSLYMCAFLTPIMVLGVLVIWFFGLSVHAFVPLFWLLILSKMLFFSPPSVKYTNRLTALGFGLPFLFLVYYIHQWSDIQASISKIQSQYYIKQKDELPEWFVYAQRLLDGGLAEQILLSPYYSQGFWDNGFFRNNQKFHDPLSIIAMAYFGEIKLSQDVLTKVLNIRYNTRHESERRLWEGSNLSTNSVSTDIQIHANYRIAYIEKTLTISHSNRINTENNGRFGGNTQEALYTFHLPEGTVVTSLSLWVNGVEEKSRLTTRQRADSAYSQIVGVQRRDPALLHWQEGNRITVRIFPCTPAENRVFKIGFTQPMKCENGRISLQNIWWEGPKPYQAQEFMRVKAIGKDIQFLNTQGFKKQLDGTLEYQGKYKSDWKIELAETPLSSEPFSFNGKKFHLEPQQTQEENFTPKQIVLDVTKSWTKTEFDRALALGKNAEIYVFAPQKIRVMPAEATQVWKELKDVNFTLLPIHQIDNLSETLIITKSSAWSPLLSDLDDAAFAKMMQRFLRNNQQTCRVLNIGNEVSNFWKSLNELRIIDLVEGDLSFAEKNIFPKNQENVNTIVLPQSKMKIVKDSGDIKKTRPNTAPDHLMRLFVYGDLMRKIGRHYFERKKYEDRFLREAEEAYILSPVTSLVVLETQKDYERFKIDANSNTLGNAKIGGEVPEPHEWLLILVSLSVFIGLFYRKKS